MRRNEEVERLRKEKARYDKEEGLSKEEEAASWKKTVEVLEKIYRDFYSYKDYRSGKFKPSPVWECEGSYTDEDKATCKKEVMRILKLCGKEDLLVDKPAVANLIYVNRLNKRGETNKDTVMKETTQVESLQEAEDTIKETVLVSSKGKEAEDMDKQWSEHTKERWGKFLKNLESNGYVEYYRKWLETVKEKSKNETATKTMDTEGLVKKEYEAWKEDEDKKMCWLETVKILKVCDQEELIDSNPYVAQELYRDCLIRNGFVEEVEKAKKIMLAIEGKKDDDATPEVKAETDNGDCIASYRERNAIKREEIKRKLRRGKL